MPELIDKAKVLKYLTPRIKTETPYGEGYNRALEDAAELVALMPTIEPEVRHGRWNDDCTEVVCSICKSEFSYEMLIFIARGIKSEHVDGMRCRCPKCGSYNRYGGDENG